MHGILGFIRYCFGIIVYVLFGMVALLTLGVIGEIVTITLGVEEYEAWEPVFALRAAPILALIAFILYWIARFLTKDTLEEIWDKIRSFSR